MERLNILLENKNILGQHFFAWNSETQNKINMYRFSWKGWTYCLNKKNIFRRKNLVLDWCAQNGIGYHGKVEHIAWKHKYSQAKESCFRLMCSKWNRYHEQVEHIAWKQKYSWTTFCWSTFIDTKWNCIGYHGKVEQWTYCRKTKYSWTSSFLFFIDMDTNILVFHFCGKNGIIIHIIYQGKVGHFAWKWTFSWTDNSCFTLCALKTIKLLVVYINLRSTKDSWWFDIWNWTTELLFTN